MKMKIREILDAVPAMNKLIAADLPLQTAYRLSVAVDGLEPHLQFFERKRSGGKELSERELEALLDYQVDVKLTPVELPLTEDVRLSAADVMHLRRLVRFTGGK